MKLNPVLLVLGLAFAALPPCLEAQSGAGASDIANPNALPAAKAIMRYLRSLPGRADRKVISGQFESWGDAIKPLSDPGNYLRMVHERTGKWVGLAGVEYPQSGGEF